ncbi:E2F-associated phosphoprotein-like [Tubulanus polymorphus]|uniref:E2F-associated phosphoprotein-like n=1 Tax=Tubulanus polymorphus TaxID=672921 RepID=UPI003DA1D0C6
MSVLQKQGDGYDIEYDSDEEPVSSGSDDELNTYLVGDKNSQKKKPRQTLKRRHKLNDKNAEETSSSDDDFEKEMKEELNKTVDNLEGRLKVNSSEASCSAGKSGTANQAKKFYDDIYFDSDESNSEEMDSTSPAKKSEKSNHPVFSNDDLLYDPQMDDDDQKWIDNQRSRCRPAIKASKNDKKHSKTDAVLNCPACMTTVCLDCQRHELYNNQYRAMFVLNCDVDYTQQLKYPVKSKKKKTKRSDNTDSENSDMDLYHPVKCTECQTEVAVMDKDEVFHFFNVLTSYS